MSRFLKECFQAMEAYTPGEQPRDMRYIKLNTNESPFPPAPEVVRALGEADIESLRLYSDPTCRHLREAIGRLYGLDAENVLPTNGSDEALNFAFLAFGGKGVVYPDISYGFYSVFARLYGLEAEKIPLKADLSIDPRDYFGKNKLIVIANPNAPTGRILSLEEVEAILQANPDSVVVIDEAYVDFGGESCVGLLHKHENLLITQTFSKSRSMAGGRLGFALGSKALIADLEKLRYSTNPYNVDSLNLKLGEVTLENNGYYMENCRKIIENREFTTVGLERLGFTVIPSFANFVFAKTDKLEGGALYAALKAKGILVRHFESPRIRDFVRITIGTKEEMTALLGAVRDILQEEAV